MTTQSSTTRRRGWQFVLLLVFFAMMAAGLVFAASWFVPVPDPLLALAVLVAVVGLVVFFVVGVREARQSGDGVLRSVGRALWGVIRLAFDLF